MASETGHTVQPHPKRRDWYLAPLSLAPQVAPAPAVYLDGGQVALHRSHLPLLSVPVERTSGSWDRTKFDLYTEPLGWKLRPYQHDACGFASARRGVLIADTMRLGKTATAVSVADVGSGCVLIVAPLSTRGVWADWCRRRWPDVAPKFLTGRSYDPSVLKGQSIVFCHYDIISSWMNVGGLKLGWLILDEAHLLNNRTAKRSQAALYLSSIAERTIALTGTPVWNRPAGVWTLLSCVAPGAWGKFGAFARRYGGPVDGAYGTSYKGTSNEEEFRARLTEVMLRRTWQEIAPHLPPIERSIETVDLSERDLYAVEHEAESVRMAARRVVPVGALARFRRLTARLKVKAAVEIAAKIVEEGDRVVVWAWHKEVIQKIEIALEQKGVIAWGISGETSAASRERAIEEWRFADAGALIVSLPVGQVGIDLSAARHAVFAELDWTPSVIAQAEMRTFSADRPMAVTYILLDHEIERNLLEAIRTKCDAADRTGLPAADTGVSAVGNALRIQDKDALSRLAEAVLSEYPDDVEDHSPFWRDE